MGKSASTLKIGGSSVRKKAKEEKQREQEAAIEAEKQREREAAIEMEKQREQEAAIEAEKAAEKDRAATEHAKKEAEAAKAEAKNKKKKISQSVKKPSDTEKAPAASVKPQAVPHAVDSGITIRDFGASPKSSKGKGKAGKPFEVTILGEAVVVEVLRDWGLERELLDKFVEAANGGENFEWIDTYFNDVHSAKPPRVTRRDWTEIKKDLVGSEFSRMLSDWETVYQNVIAVTSFLHSFASFMHKYSATLDDFYMECCAKRKVREQLLARKGETDQIYGDRVRAYMSTYAEKYRTKE